MNTPRTTVSHRTQYLLLRLFELFFRLLPRPLALRAGAAFGMLLYHCRIRRRVVDRNLRHVGCWNEAQMKRITRSLYRMTGRYIADFLRGRPGSLPYEFHAMDTIKRVLARGKGTLLVLGHYGNWEALAVMFGRAVPSLHVVAMPMRNTQVERWLLRKRDTTGVITIHKGSATRRVLAALRQNSMVAVLIDQHIRGQCTLAPFLGTQAPTVRTVAGLLQHTGCSVLLVYAVLNAQGVYQVHVEEGRELGVSPERADEFIAAYQADHNDVLSRWIRQAPEHWFGWFHRRFGDLVNYHR